MQKSVRTEMNHEEKNVCQRCSRAGDADRQRQPGLKSSFMTYNGD